MHHGRRVLHLSAAFESSWQPILCKLDDRLNPPSQFTSFGFTGVLKDADVAISMDGRGRCMDNIFIERLWRSLKYEAVYLHELTDGFKAERVIGEWIDFHNTERPHSSLDGQTPAEVYGATRPVDMIDKAPALPTSPQAQQPQQDVINRILAA